jgi:transcriptional regulator with XRE-family HTH domain
MQVIGLIIQKLRKQKQLTQAAFAHEVGIPSQSKISAWESGQNVPDILEAQKIADFFGVSVEFLLKGDCM